MVGSVPELGFWDANSAGLRLNWSEGHIWRIKVPKASLPDSFEFKFVVRARDVNATDVTEGRPYQADLVRWEGDPNHKFDLQTYIKQFNQPVILEALRDEKE